MDFLNHANSPQPPVPPRQKKTPLIVSQGTYGCVYYPGFTCTGKVQNTKYITKLQKNDETLKNELEIGEKIQKIKNYNYYFAPILKQCPVSLSTLQQKFSEPLKQCNVIQKSEQNSKENPNQENFNVNKIRYILGEELDKMFEKKRLSKAHPLPFLIDCHNYLSKSLQKLKTKNILHYDLKENNIIYDKESQIPIIIDFGLSVPLDKINPTAPDPELLTQSFFDVYEYDYWCLEPILIGIYASHYENFTKSTTPILTTNETPAKTPKEKYNQQKISELLMEKYKETIDEYMKYAYIFKPEFQSQLSQRFPPTSPVQKTIQTFTKTFHTKWQTYLKNHESDTLLLFFQTLWKARFTWDHYSLAVIFIGFISQIPPLPPDDPQLPALETFTQFLLNQILSLPQERKNIPPKQ